MKRFIASVCGCILLQLATPILADDPKPAKTVEQVAEAARKSVVVITVEGRDGKRQGLGTGFVISADGLIATNLHVIGEARPITVQFADGTPRPVTTVHASDRSLDLAVLKIQATKLTPLELADSDQLKEGQTVVAVGNPLGLTHSIVSGVVSARRDLDGRSMIQIAMPIEPGNSGGPLIDLRGRVHGILTMKSVLTPNLGFAVPSNSLKPLLQKPNPILMSRWLTIGSLDPAEWAVLFDAHWKRRTGKIVAEGMGTSFGGRSLCLFQKALPPAPFEVGVSVRLDNEAGAAGLVFHADGGDKHYGFYPSGGQLRLTRFDGADVFSWTILKQVASAAYHPGESNALKVRIEEGKFRCFVNGQVVIESTDHAYNNGKVGLAKFRDTRAEFKDFVVANEIRVAKPSDEVVKDILGLAAGLEPKNSGDSDKLKPLVAAAPASVAVLRDRARQLEQQAARLKDLASAVHQRSVQAELGKVLETPEERIDLFHAALLIARLDNEDVDLSLYRRELDQMVHDIRASLAKDADNRAKLAAINKYLFAQRGFHGSRADYYNRSNSYLNEVIDDREGLPITLSVLYMEIGRRLGLEVVGIGLPGHFVVRYQPAGGKSEYVDAYDSGQAVSMSEVRKRVEAATGRAFDDAYLTPVSKRAIIVRMLHNLLGIARTENDMKGVLRYLDTILVASPQEGPDRLMRSAVRYQAGEREGSLADLEWLVEHQPADVPMEKVRQLERLLKRAE